MAEEVFKSCGVNVASDEYHFIVVSHSADCDTVKVYVWWVKCTVAWVFLVKVFESFNRWNAVRIVTFILNHSHPFLFLAFAVFCKIYCFRSHNVNECGDSGETYCFKNIRTEAACHSRFLQFFCNRCYAFAAVLFHFVDRYLPGVCLHHLLRLRCRLCGCE